MHQAARPKATLGVDFADFSGGATPFRRSPRDGRLNAGGAVITIAPLRSTLATGPAGSSSDEFEKMI